MYAEVPLSPDQVLWRSRQERPAVIPADGCVDLIAAGDRILVCGPQTRWIAAGAGGSTGFLGIRFAPGTALSALAVDLRELKDQIVSAEDVLGRPAGLLRDALLCARDSSHPVAELAALASSDAPAAWVAYIRHQALLGTSAREAAQAVSWSERTLRRRMLVSFGYGYATLRRIVRSRRAHSLLTGGMPPAQAATVAGYADQAHLCRELARLIGTTPDQLASSGAKRSTALPSGSSTVA